MSTHVASSGHLLEVVLAAIGSKERREKGGEEERLQH